MTDNDMNDIVPVSGEIVPENQDIQKRLNTQEQICIH